MLNVQNSFFSISKLNFNKQRTYTRKIHRPYQADINSTPISLLLCSTTGAGQLLDAVQEYVGDDAGVGRRYVAGHLHHDVRRVDVTGDPQH